MLCVEIIPGKSIGPIRLGMTRDEIAKFGKHAGSDHMEYEYDASGRCSKITVSPVCRANRFLPESEPFVLMLAGHELFDLNVKTIRELFDIGAKEIEYEMCAEVYPTIGLLLEWDIWEGVSADPYRVSVFASQPPSETPSAVPKLDSTEITEKRKKRSTRTKRRSSNTAKPARKKTRSPNKNGKDHA